MPIRTSLDGVMDVLLHDGRVARVGKDLPAGDASLTVIDCSGRIVCPGFLDMHVHLREPGQEYKETIQSGTAAAVACMANTDPVNDCVPVTQSIVRLAREIGHCRVWPIAAVTRGMEGREITEFGELEAAGAVALSDDGRPIADASVMRRALEYVGMFDMPIIDHCEDPALSQGGQVHEGWLSTRLGLRGIPGAAEDLHVARDIMLAELTGSAVHIAHVSTARAIELVRHGKRVGIRVTCEAAPHHFLLDDEAVGNFRTCCKMKPPLRSASDVRAVLRGIADGTVDAIATDHAPHHADEKDTVFDEAAFGVVGLETAVSLALHHLVRDGSIDLSRLVDLMSRHPCRILGVPGGTLAVGTPADVTILDLARDVTVEPERFRSKGRSTPFAGMSLVGAPVMTIVGGRIAFDADRDQTTRTMP